jgi:GntR family histidine utilization transcriptional repressor
VGKTGNKEATLHQTILSEIEGRIVSGEWPPGFRLPFEVNLAEQYGCSRMTVNKVMTQLAKAGLVERTRKAGTFVRTPRAQAAVLELHGIEAEVETLGLPYGYELLSRTQRQAALDDARFIDVPRNTPLLELLAVHRAGELPFCVEERRINVAAVPEAQTADFAQHAPGGWLIAQVPWTTAENHIQAAPASSEIAQLLGVARGTACLVVERRTWSHNGPVTFVRLTYPGDRHSLVARFAPAQG